MKFWTYNPSSKDTEIHELPERPGSFALCDTNHFDPDTYLFAFESGPIFYNISRSEYIGDHIFKFEPNQPTLPNDGRCDKQGRFIFGGHGMDPFDQENPIKAASNVYRIGTDLSHELLIRNVSCTNSICFSNNGDTMYFTDSFADYPIGPTIFKYKYDNDVFDENNRDIFGILEPPKDAAFCVPDGSVVDAEDGVWNSATGTGKVYRFNKDGIIDTIVNVPEPCVTCAAFGGKDLDILYITTFNFSEAIDSFNTGLEKGALYSVKLPFRGCKEDVFLGK